MEIPNAKDLNTLLRKQFYIVLLRDEISRKIQENIPLLVDGKTIEFFLKQENDISNTVCEELVAKGYTVNFREILAGAGYLQITKVPRKQSVDIHGSLQCNSSSPGPSDQSCHNKPS